MTRLRIKILFGEGQAIVMKRISQFLFVGLVLLCSASAINVSRIQAVVYDVLPKIVTN